MGRSAATDDWLRRITSLTVEPEADRGPESLAEARARVSRLTALARVLSPVTLRHRSSCCCGDRPCGLRHVPGGAEACRLAAELARVAPSGPSAGVSDADAAARYLDALRGASGAVYYCRRVAHAADLCWFTTEGPSPDVCGRVLAAAHHLRGGRRAS